MWFSSKTKFRTFIKQISTILRDSRGKDKVVRQARMYNVVQQLSVYNRRLYTVLRCHKLLSRVSRSSSPSTYETAVNVGNQKLEVRNFFQTAQKTHNWGNPEPGNRSRLHNLQWQLYLRARKKEKTKQNKTKLHFTGPQELRSPHLLCSRHN